MMHGCEARRKKRQLTSEDETVLEELLKRMREAMPAEGAFVKLAARSCKDSILRSQRFKDVLAEQVASRAPVSPNDFLTCYVRAQALAGRRFEADDALEDMLQSRRIYEDLTLACLERKGFSMDIVFRAWDEQLVPEMELRLFCNHGSVSCISQYYSSLYVEQLSHRRSELQPLVLAYAAQCMAQLSLPAYVLDLGIREDGSFTVIELNPPAPRSGPALFVWNEGSGSGDNAVLQGEAPFEFRTLDQPLPNVTEELRRTFEHLHTLGYTWEEKDDAKCTVQ